MMMRATTILAALFAVVLLHAGQLPRLRPISARPASIPSDGVLLTDEGVNQGEGRVILVRDLTQGGIESGPTVAGLSLWHAIGIDVDSGGRIYVGDRTNRRIVRMDDVAGNGWVALASAGGQELALPGVVNGVETDTGIYGMAVDSAGRINVSSAKPQRLLRVDDMSGAGFATFQIPGEIISAINNAVDARDRIYFADNQRHYIARMNEVSGAGLVRLGSLGAGLHQFKQPQGIAFDNAGRIYVSDEDNGRIIRMDDMNGAGWTTFGTFGHGEGNFAQPHGLAVDRAGRIWISDTGNWRVVRINSMAGDGWVSFGVRELQGRSLNFGANKGIKVMGLGARVPYQSVFPQLSVPASTRLLLLGMNIDTVDEDFQVSFGSSVDNPRGCNSAATDCGATLNVTLDGAAGSSFRQSVPAFGGVRLTTALPADANSPFSRIETTGPFAGTALIQMLNGTTITSEVAFAPAAPLAHSLVYVDNRDGAQSRVTMHNAAAAGTPRPGFAHAGLNLTLRNTAGAVVATQFVNLSPGVSLTRLVSEIFPAAIAGFEGSLDINTGQSLAQVETTAMRYENGGTEVFTALPVFVDLANAQREAPVNHRPLPGDETTTLYLPHLVDGGGYRSSLVVANPSDNATTARVELINADGSLLANYPLPIAPQGVASLTTDGSGSAPRQGWARVTASRKINGAIIVSRIADGRRVAETLVPAAALATQLIAHVENRGSTSSAVVVANPQATPARVTYVLRDRSGQVAGSVSESIPALGYAAHLVTQLFTGANDFDGSIEVRSDGPPITGTGLRYDNPGGTVFTAMPATRIR